MREPRHTPQPWARPVDGQRCDDEGQAKSQRIECEQQDPHLHGRFCSCDGKRDAEGWPDARCPSGREEHTHQEGGKGAQTRIRYIMVAEVKLKEWNSQPARYLQPEENDHDSADAGDPFPISEKNPPKSGCGCAQCNEYDAETSRKRNTMEQDFPPAYLPFCIAARTRG